MSDQALTRPLNKETRPTESPRGANSELSSNKLMEWHLLQLFEASREVIQEGSRAKDEVIFCLGFDGDQDIFFADILHLLPQTTGCLRDQKARGQAFKKLICPTCL